jgi:hypothetical protein
MEYLNLRLNTSQYQNDNGVERFRVRVSESPAGEQAQGTAEDVTLSPDLRQRVRRLEKRTLNREEMIALGDELGQALFPPRARKFYDNSLAGLGEGQALRLQLELETYALADLPWEYCYFSDPNTPEAERGTEGFLVLQQRVSLVRYQVLAQRLMSLRPVKADSLRLVAIFSNPAGTEALDVDIEQTNIKKALEAVPEIKPEFYQQATRNTLLDALINNAHVFHFSGHGKFEGQIGGAYGGEEGQGFIVLTGNNGEEDQFPAQKLATTLSGKGVRLAMLGACETSKLDQVNAWTGVAPALTRAGLPAVVGMKFKVKDDSAIAFSRRFYQALANHQTIDEAVTAGRLAIDALSNDEQERDWGVPVLYLRAEEGVLFPATTETAELPKPPPPQLDPEISKALGTTRDKLTGDADYGYLLKRFENILEQWSTLRDYKSLHDGLHEIQYTYYQNIIRNIKIVMDDKWAKYDLKEYLRGYRREVVKMEEATVEGKVTAVENRWVAQLDQAGKDLEEGINKGNKSQIDLASQTINQVIGQQPAVINKNLYFAVFAYNNNVPELLRTMNKVHEKFPPETGNFEKGINSLRELNAKLSALIDEHNTWQDADNQLRGLFDLLEDGVVLFNKRWQKLRAGLETFYVSDEEESSVLHESSVRLKEADELLESAIADGDPEGVRRTFENYCSQASERFFYVDKSVMELCNRLSQIRDELN